MNNNKGVKAPKSNAERQEKLKLDRSLKGIFKRSFWLTDEQHTEMKAMYKKLTGNKDVNS